MAAYMRQRYRKNSLIIRQLKVDRGCTDCGYNENHAALEFDHLNGRESDRDTVAQLMGKSINRIMKEIAKCEVVCANCHRIRTFTRLQDSRAISIAA
jgi:hypothetical protein